jgi:hypothetical protein
VNDKREIKSFWWSPSQPETRWFGTLTLETNKTPKLELFVERRSPMDGRQSMGHLIHGMDEHGKPITLLFVSSLGESFSGAVVKRTFDAGYVLIGIAVSDVESFVINSIRFQVQHLYGWIGKSGFDRKTVEYAGTFIVNFRRHDDEWFQITDDLELGIHNTFTANSGFQERRIKEDAGLTFRSKLGFSLKYCNELITSIRILIHFASLKRVYPVWMTAYKDGHGYQADERWIDQDIEIVSSNLREAKSEYPVPGEWLFQFHDVRNDFTGFIRKWLEYKEKFSEAIGCYSCTIYHSLTDELSHLSLTQALEAYHSIRYASHQNQDFQSKIEDLCKLHANSLKGLVDDIGDFSERVLCSRNYYTHHNPKWLMKGKVARRRDLYLLNEKLRLLFQMCVLADLEISENRFRLLRRQLASEVVDLY